MFDGKIWYWLGKVYLVVLWEFVWIKEVEVGEYLSGVIDWYIVECLLCFKFSIQDVYLVVCEWLCRGLGYNCVGQI